MLMASYIYILTNKPNGTLYIGVTSDIVRRVYEHRIKAVKGFAEKYNLTQLVYFERYEHIEDAIHREKCMKEWKREWKVRRIEEMNPEWKDLYEAIVA
jgi:putative endonuclease